MGKTVSKYANGKVVVDGVGVGVGVNGDDDMKSVVSCWLLLTVAD